MLIRCQMVFVRHVFFFFYGEASALYNTISLSVLTNRQDSKMEEPQTINLCICFSLLLLSPLWFNVTGSALLLYSVYHTQTCRGTY